MSVNLLSGDCLAKLDELESNSIDSTVTDPPYFIGMHGKKWDKAGPSPKDIQESHFLWSEKVFRVMKPGAFLLAFSACRTVHRMTCALEDAGFEIRDQLGWVHPQAMAKSMDLAKAIDKYQFELWLLDNKVKLPKKEWSAFVSDYVQGKATELFLSLSKQVGIPPWGVPQYQPDGTVLPAHPDAKAYFGKGTGLRPVWEPIVLARKPLVGTVVENVYEYGTGFLDIDGCRIPTEDAYVINRFTKGAKPFGDAKGEEYESVTSKGRFPPNLLIEPGGEVDDTFVVIEGKPHPSKPQKRDHEKMDTRESGFRFKRSNIFHQENSVGDGFLGGYTRLFVVPKPSPKEKDAGLDHKNTHETVKPVSLMKHLVRLITPPNGLCLDPFMGSGTTGMACVDEGRRFIGIEKEVQHFNDATARINFRMAGLQRSAASIEAQLYEEENV